MFLARFTGPDVLFLVSFSWLPNARIYVWVTGVRQWGSYIILLALVMKGLVYSASEAFVPSISADASHQLYPEGHGQQGFFISNGSAPVRHRSTKIKMITRSSSESELCGAEESATYAVWYRLLLQGMCVIFSGPISSIRTINALSLWRCKVKLSSEPSIWSDVRATFGKGLKLETSCWSSSPQRKWKQTSWQSRCLVLCWTRWRIDCVFMKSRSWNVRLQMVSHTSRHDADRVSEIFVCPWPEEIYARRRKCSVWSSNLIFSLKLSL